MLNFLLLHYIMLITADSNGINPSDNKDAHQTHRKTLHSLSNFARFGDSGFGLSMAIKLITDNAKTINLSMR